jgi:hypothetical protein
VANDRPLNSAQHRAARLLGLGRTAESVAAEVGTSSTSIRRWKRRDDFAALVKQARDDAIDEAPSARSVLESALHATDKSGHPMWKVRLEAARLLLLGNDAEPVEPRVERVFVGPEDGGARPDPRTKVH